MKDMPILQNIKLVKIDANTKESIKEKFTFGLYEDEECKDLIKEYESNKEEGTIIFEDLRYGTLLTLVGLGVYEYKRKKLVNKK